MSFNRVRCVLKTNACGPEHRVKVFVMRATKRHRKPGYVIPSADMIVLYRLTAPTQNTSHQIASRDLRRTSFALHAAPASDA